MTVGIGAGTAQNPGALYFQQQIMNDGEFKRRLKEAVKKSPEPLTLIIQADANAPSGADISDRATGGGSGNHECAACPAARPIRLRWRERQAMNDVAMERPGWPTGKWLMVIAGFFAVQAGFFCWFGRPLAKPLRGSSSAFTVHLVDGPVGEIPGYASPLLLARADRHGFSEKAWLRTPPLTYNPGESNQPPVFLEPHPGGLGLTLARVLSNEVDQPYMVAQGPAVQSASLAFLPPVEDPPISSYITIEGGLAGRRLRRKPELKPQPADAILKNTIVDVVVDAEGRVFGPPVLAPASAAAPADYANANADALAASAALRFEPLPRAPWQSYQAPGSGLASGRVVFHWQTVPRPPPTTNDTSSLR